MCDNTCARWYGAWFYGILGAFFFHPRKSFEWEIYWHRKYFQLLFLGSKRSYWKLRLISLKIIPLEIFFAFFYYRIFIYLLPCHVDSNVVVNWGTSVMPNLLNTEKLNCMALETIFWSCFSSNLLSIEAKIKIF